jgi:hypothetical protein
MPHTLQMFVHPIVWHIIFYFYVWYLWQLIIDRHQLRQSSDTSHSVSPCLDLSLRSYCNVSNFAATASALVYILFQTALTQILTCNNFTLPPPPPWGLVGACSDVRWRGPQASQSGLFNFCFLSLLTISGLQKWSVVIFLYLCRFWCINVIAV